MGTGDPVSAYAKVTLTSRLRSASLSRDYVYLSRSARSQNGLGMTGYYGRAAARSVVTNRFDR